MAAVIASGAADVGMGVRAAAASFGLDSVALGEESYYPRCGTMSRRWPPWKLPPPHRG